MLRSLEDPERYSVAPGEGDLGSVVNFRLDDQPRTAREMARLLDRRKA